MPTYKLLYFNARGLAEVTRWIFAHAGQEYEDFRWEREDWVPKYKPLSPTGQGPYLEVDGVKIAQSGAIARYAAKQCGLSGKNDLEQALVDMVASCADDFRVVYTPLFYEPDEAKKEAARNEIVTVKGPAGLVRLENLLKSNKNGDGYFVGDSLTWADFQVAITLDVLARANIADQLDKYPKLKAHKARIEQLPKIAEWIAKRPNTPV